MKHKYLSFKLHFEVQSYRGLFTVACFVYIPFGMSRFRHIVKHFGESYRADFSLNHTRSQKAAITITTQVIQTSINMIMD